MPFELRLPPDTQSEIDEFISSIAHSRRETEEILRAVIDGLQVLEVNPLAGTTFYGGPFETRRVFRYQVVAGGTAFDVSVVYKVFKEDAIVVVAGFSATPLR